MTAPQPPRDSAEPPRPVIRKLGFASATTKPSNQLMVLRSSRSSTAAVAMNTSRLVDVEKGKRAVRCNPIRFGGSRSFSYRGGTAYLCASPTCDAPPCEPVRPWRKIGTGMKDPAITLRCDCGTDGRAAYGQQWTCPACGKRYDTGDIPVADYDAIRSLNRRYRVAGFVLVGILALILLAVALTRQVIPIFAGLAVVTITWFLYLKPLVHRRHRRAVNELTRTWDLK